MFLTPTILLTILAMLAFAGNSLLCRLALKHTGIDTASFTLIRLLSGALVLWLIVSLQDKRPTTLALESGSWWAAIALFVYAACFSIAYISLSAGTGALLLFGAVQVTMISYGLWRGERLSRVQTLGVMMAVAGLARLLLPGLSTPPLQGAVLMLLAGVAWGVYSLLGRGVKNPIQTTAGNFLRSVPLAIALVLILRSDLVWNSVGALYAVASGAIASGVGYALWYYALPQLRATQAATMQLSVPILAALGGIIFLSETLTLRLVLASIAVLGGISLVLRPSEAAKVVKHDSY